MLDKPTSMTTIETPSTTKIKLLITLATKTTLNTFLCVKFKELYSSHVPVSVVICVYFVGSKTSLSMEFDGHPWGTTLKLSRGNV